MEAQANRGKGMYRIFQVQEGSRSLIGGAPTLQQAQAMVMRAAGNPLLDGAQLGGYRGPNEFLPRLPGMPRYEIIPIARDPSVGRAA